MCLDKPKEFFGYGNNHKPRAPLCPVFSSDGHLVTDDEEMAKECNNYFSSFLGGCLQVAEAGMLKGLFPDALKDHQGPEGPYTRHSKGCLDGMPRGTTECPRCSRPGDLLKQTAGDSTLGFLPGGAGGWCGVCSFGHGDRGSVEGEVGKKLETVETNSRR